MKEQAPSPRESTGTTLLTLGEQWCPTVCATDAAAAKPAPRGDGASAQKEHWQEHCWASTHRHVKSLPHCPTVHSDAFSSTCECDYFSSVLDDCQVSNHYAPQVTLCMWQDLKINPSDPILLETINPSPHESPLPLKLGLLVLMLTFTNPL